MTTNTETNKFVIDVDGRSGAAGLQQVRTSADNLGGGLDRVRGSLGRLDAATRESKKILGSFSSGMGEGGKAMSSLLGTVGDLAGAFATGGVAFLAFSAAAAIIGKIGTAMKEASENAKIFEAGVAAMEKTVAAATSSALQPARMALQSLVDELKNVGKDALQIKHDLILETVKDFDRREESVSRHLTEARAKLAEEKEKLSHTFLSGERATAQESIDTQEKVVRVLEARHKQIVALASESRAALNEATGAISAIESKKIEQERAARGPAKDVDRGPEMRAAIDRVRKSVAADEEAEQRRIASSFRVAAVFVSNQTMMESAEDHRHRIAVAHMEEEKRQLKDATKEAEAFGEALVQSVAVGAFGTATRAMTEFFVGLATGEKYAAEQALAHFTQSVGQQIQASGVQAVVKGTLMNLEVPGSGIPLIAGGIAAIGVGTAMEVGGAAMSANIQAKMEAGGGVSGGGVGARSSGSGGASGGGFGSGERNRQATFVFNYGVMGPSPDATARAVANANNVALDRGYSGRQQGVRNRRGPML